MNRVSNNQVYYTYNWNGMIQWLRPYGLWVKISWVQIPALPFVSDEVLGKLVSLSSY